MDRGIVRDGRLRLAALCGLAATVIVALTYVPAVEQALSPVVCSWIYYLLLLPSLATMVTAGVLLWRSFARGEVLKLIWAFLTLGMGLWAVAEVLSGYYELIAAAEVVYPSPADLLWVIGYLPLFAALLLRFRSLRARPAGWQWGLALGIFVGLAALAVVFVIGPIVADPHASLLEKVLNVVYPVGDLAVALIALLCMLVLVGGELSWPWGTIATGYLIMALADLLYGYAEWQGIYPAALVEGRNFIAALADVPYFASYVIVVLGVYMQARLQRVA